MGFLDVSLEWLESNEFKQGHADHKEIAAHFAKTVNNRFIELSIPLRVRTFGTYWTVIYTQASRYNWLYTYYLVLEGCCVHFAGSTRQNFSVEWTKDDFDDLADKMVNAALKLQADGWWWSDPTVTQTKMLAKEVFKRMLPSCKKLCSSRRSDQGLKEPLMDA